MPDFYEELEKYNKTKNSLNISLTESEESAKLASKNLIEQNEKIINITERLERTDNNIDASGNIVSRISRSRLYSFIILSVSFIMIVLILIIVAYFIIKGKF